MSGPEASEGLIVVDACLEEAEHGSESMQHANAL